MAIKERMKSAKKTLSELIDTRKETVDEDSAIGVQWIDKDFSVWMIWPIDDTEYRYSVSFG